MNSKIRRPFFSSCVCLLSPIIRFLQYVLFGLLTVNFLTDKPFICLRFHIHLASSLEGVFAILSQIFFLLSFSFVLHYRYYQRFGEIKRQAAIDFFLGHSSSPELRFLQNCASPELTVHSVSLLSYSHSFPTPLIRILASCD